MSNDNKIVIIYRENDYYTSLDDFILQFIDIHLYDITLYNYTNEILDKKFNKIENHDLSDSDVSVSDTISFFYSEHLNKHCLLFDACIQYNNKIVIQDILGKENTFIKIIGDTYNTYMILGRKIIEDNIQIISDFNNNYSIKDTILLEGTINHKFLHNLTKNNRLFVYILECISNIKNDKNELNKIISSDDQLYYKHLLQVLNETPNIKTIEVLLELLDNDFQSIDVIYLLIQHIDSVSDFILDETIFDFILDKIEELISNEYSDIPSKSLLELKTKKQFILYDFVINYNLNKPFINIDTIPHWIYSDNNSAITIHYPTLTIGDIVVIEYPFKIDNNTTLLSHNIYGLDDIILNIKADKIICNDDDIIFNNKNGMSILYYEEVIHLYTQLNPLMIYSINDTKLEIIEDGIFTLPIEYTLIGNIVTYNSYFLGLIQVQNNSFRLIILDAHTLDCVELSRNFNISQGSACGLYVNKSKLYILGNITKDEVKILYKQELSSEILFLELTNVFNINSNIQLKINEKNNIFLDVEDWHYESNIYENFSFSNNADIAETYDIKASYNPKTRLLKIDDKIIYKKEFIYLPNRLNIPNKTYELCFHKSTYESLLYTKSQELGISISKDYKYAKYLIIEQVSFEKLTSLELSEIINNNTLIISLIDEDLLNSNKLVNNYTSNQLLTKLFLFNIVKNSTYIEFVFDRIIHKYEYDDRENFIQLDKEHIFEEVSIFKNVLELYKSPHTINIELSDKEQEVCKILQSKILNKLDPDIYKNLLNICKYIIKHNYNLEILINIPTTTNHKIYNIVKKVNWLGSVYLNINPNLSNIHFNIIFIDTQSKLSHMTLKNEGLIYILDSNVLLKI